jgi:succinyl-CoA synthetase beta subunit/citryl-CoA synthetase large subunit
VSWSFSRLTTVPHPDKAMEPRIGTSKRKTSGRERIFRPDEAGSTGWSKAGWRDDLPGLLDRVPRRMRFYEYEARKIVELAGIPVTKYGFCTSAEEARKVAEEIGGPVVIKSQVLSGGRMKAGGVKFADTPDEAAQHAEEILKLEINGHMPRGVLVDPKAEVKQEYYAGVVWDGTAKKPLMLFSDMGGIDIEEVAEQHPDHVGKGHVSNLLPVGDFEAKQVVAATGVTGSQLNRATPVLARLARLFLENDMTLAEINPLAELTDGKFVALDAHMEMEAEAVGRQKKLLRKELGIAEDDTRETYEPSDFEKNVSAIDAADHRGVIQGKDHGFTGNLGLVIGAGGGSLTLTDAVRNLEKDGVEKIAVMMSIVSNTRVDIVARGVIKACLELGKDPGETIAIFRIPGAWEDEGFKILEKYGVEYCDRSVSMWEAAGRAVSKIQGEEGVAA